MTTLSETYPKDLQDIADGLVVSHMVGPSRSLRRDTSVALGQLSRNERKWCEFLDHLSWLCDYQPGGKKIASIAVRQSRSDEFVFIITTNSNGSGLSTMYSHLEKILEQLRSLPNDSAGVKKRILEWSIELSKKRVRLYSANLEPLIKKFCKRHVEALGKGTRSTVEDEPLADFLTSLGSHLQTPDILCHQADEFRNSPYLDRLQTKIAENPRSGLYSGLRHHLGRLGAWHKACRAVCKMASLRPEVFMQGKCEKLSPPRMTSAPELRHDGNFEAVINRFLRNDPIERTRLIAAFSNPPEDPPDVNVDLSDGEAEDSVKTKSMSVHAESTLLQHFYKKSFPFAFGFNYIGCSKRSCYFCDLFARCHPLKTITRPCHGDTFLKWTLPPPITDAASVSTIRRMVQQVREDMPERVITTREGVHGSSTGLTRST